MSRFTDKRVVVTGVGSGIGRAAAILFAAEGATVACIDVQNEEATVETITSSGGRAHAYTCDVSDVVQVEQTVEAAAAQMGGIDIVLNIAGIGHFANSHQEDPAAFDKVLATNLNGTFYMCRFALPHLITTGNGVIVNTASNAGFQGLPWSAAYCASKGGVIQLTRALGFEYRGKGVRVCAVAPGGTNTNIHHQFTTLPEGADYREMTKMMSPMPNAEPSEMAECFAYVASDAARFMTSTVVSLDGGLTC